MKRSVNLYALESAIPQYRECGELFINITGALIQVSEDIQVAEDSNNSALRQEALREVTDLIEAINALLRLTDSIMDYSDRIRDLLQETEEILAKG